MKIFVCPCKEKEKSMAALPSVTAALIENGLTPVFDESVSELYCDERAEYMSGDIIGGCDMLLTVGGDGMMLKWGRKAALAGKPLIGINTGRLGFMTSLDIDCLDKLSAIADGSCTFSTRMMLSAELSGKTSTALNDIVLFKDVNSKLPEFTVRINGTTVTKVRADGLIFSTPTGSTAYALSAGGPIIEPTVECILLTPLCAHTLLNRPMIFGAGDEVTVSYAAYEGSRVNMSIDGSRGTEFAAENMLVIRKSPYALRIAELGEKSFYTTVSEKLMTPLK